MVHALLMAALAFRSPAANELHTIAAGAATALYRDLNRARRRHGLGALALDRRLDRAAIVHVADMARRNYFAHESPEGNSPFDRLRQAGCDYRYAGENIAMAPDERIADWALFRSPPHRENILSPNYRRVGIAVSVTAAGELLFVEDFSD